MEERFWEDVELLRKSLTETLSPDERSRLDSLLNDPEMERIYRQLQDGDFLKGEYDRYAAFSAREGYLKFENNLLRRKLRHVILRLSVAAVLLTGIATSLVVFSTRETDRPVVEMPSISPGSSKAFLTLADGRQIDLSSGQPLAINEKGVDIQSDKGTLSYSVKDQSAETTYHEMNIPKGGEYHFVLGDGTQVWLNADTKLKYPANMGGKVRELFLDGEAYFDVKKDGRPFIVNTRLGKIEVRGTQFGITGYDDQDQMTATLLSGSIRFTSGTGQSFDLVPGEQVMAGKDGNAEKYRVNPDEHVGWKDGIYVFWKKPLGEIMSTFERWYNVSVAYDDPSIAQIRFTGNVRRYDNINTFLEALSTTQEVDFNIEGTTITLLRADKE